MGVLTVSAPRAENIGPRGRRRRLVGGLAALAGGTVGFAALAVVAAPSWSAVAPLPLFYFGALGVLQAREKT